MIYILFLLLFLFSCGFLTNGVKNIKYGNGICQKIHLGDGPEDFVYDEKAKRLIVSSHERRGWAKNGDLYGVSINDHQVEKLKRVGEPRGFSLVPHGIDLVKKRNGQRLLYVISHGETPEDKRHEVVVYELKNNELRFLRSHQDPLLRSPNDLFALPSGEIFVTNDGSEEVNIFSLLFGAKNGDLVHYDGEKWNLFSENFIFANGVMVTEKYIFVASTLEDIVYQYEFSSDRKSRLIHKYSIPYPDNIQPVDPENIVVTSHSGLFDFFKHAGDPAHPSPSVVHQIHIKDKTSQIIYSNDGTQISAASTAMKIKNQLFISQVFNGFILACR